MLFTMETTTFVVVFMCVLPCGWGQSGKGNANDYMDNVLQYIRNTTNDTLTLDQEKFIVIVDLVLLQPELHVELRDGEMRGLHSLNRSSDAVVTYSEDTGLPIYTVEFSLRLSDMTMVSRINGKLEGLLLKMPLPSIKQKSHIESVEFKLAIDLNLKNFSDLKVSTRDVEITDIGHIEVDIKGLIPELDSLASPISSLLINAVKRDLRGLVSPFIQESLDQVLKKRTPRDITKLIG